jgi:hypothetical protein
LDAGDFHLGFEKADFKRSVSMNWHHNSIPNAFLEENMVTALDSGQRPPLIGQKTAKNLCQKFVSNSQLKKL